MATDSRLRRRGQRGLSYVEALIAVVVVAVCLAPALDALRVGMRVAATQRSHGTSGQRVKARLEEVVANKFATLDAAAMAAGNTPSSVVAAYSDAAGAADRLLVNLYRYNGSAATGSDTGLLRIKVSIEGSALALETLKSRW